MNKAVKCALVATLAMTHLTSPAQDAPTAHTFYVCETGDNANDGLSPRTPKRNIEKAVLASADGDTVLVAEGTYSGILGSGAIGIRRAVALRGGYSRDFSERDIRKHATIISPTSGPGVAQKTPVITVAVKSDGAKMEIDGLVIDGGNMTAYCVPNSPDEVKAPRMAAHGTCGAGGPDLKVNGVIMREQPLLYIGGSTADVTIRNCAFINAPSNAIMGVAAGRLTVKNNIFVNCRLSAMTVRAAKPDGANTIEFSRNTTVFTWTSAAGAQDAGCAITLLPGTNYSICGNIFALCATAAIDNREAGDGQKRQMRIADNVFADNKDGDIAQDDRKLPFAQCSEMAELKWIKGGKSNASAQSLQIFGENIDRAYANAFIAQARDGGDKMYANRYDTSAAMLLWGAMDGRGAQLP